MISVVCSGGGGHMARAERETRESRASCVSTCSLLLRTSVEVCKDE